MRYLRLQKAQVNLDEGLNKALVLASNGWNEDTRVFKWQYASITVVVLSPYLHIIIVFLEHKS